MAEIDVTTTTASFVISANNTTATSYQWIDCATNLQISGATNSSYTATANGDYKVEITEANCTSSSDCVTIADLGLNNSGLLSGSQIYPNPTKGEFTVTFNNKVNNNTTITVYSIDGKVVLNQAITNSKTSVNLTAYEKGIYFVKINAKIV